jgi:hypothetical protein
MLKPLKLDGSQHEVRDTDVARYLRRELKDPHVFTYFHHRTRNFVVCTWFSESGGLCNEHATLRDIHDAAAVSQALRNVLRMRGPQHYDDMRKVGRTLRAQHSEGIEEAQENADSYLGAIEFMKRRSHKHAGHPGWDR